MPAVDVPMSLRIPRGAKEELRSIAARQKRSAHALATEAVLNMIAEASRLQAWNDSCDESLAHYAQTGLHATQAEVTAWIDSWGKPNELPLPAPHT